MLLKQCMNYVTLQFIITIDVKKSFYVARDKNEDMMINYNLRSKGD